MKPIKTWEDDNYIYRQWDKEGHKIDRSPKRLITENTDRIILHVTISVNEITARKTINNVVDNQYDKTLYFAITRLSDGKQGAFAILGFREGTARTSIRITDPGIWVLRKRNIYPVWSDILIVNHLIVEG